MNFKFLILGFRKTKSPPLPGQTQHKIEIKKIKNKKIREREKERQISSFLITKQNKINKIHHNLGENQQYNR